MNTPEAVQAKRFKHAKRQQSSSGGLLFCDWCGPLQEVGYQHGKLLFTGWARGDIIKNMLKDHRSADYNDSKRTDVRLTHTHT